MINESNSSVETEKSALKETQKKVEVGFKENVSLSSDTESFVSLYEAEAEEEMYILENIEESDSDSQLDDEPDYMKRTTFPSETNFFEIFEEIPSFDNISADTAIDSIPSEEPDSVEVILEVDSIKDIGRFVNPLTGLIVSEESLSLGMENQEEPQEVEEEETEGSYNERDNSYSSDLFAGGLDSDNEKMSDAIDETLEVFLELQKEPEVIEPKEISLEFVKRQEEAKRVQQNTEEFLSALINKVVELAEQLTPEKLLQQNLDKRKLLAELADKFQHYSIEKNVCSFLNRQAVRHFRRKKYLRVIMEDNPKTLLREKEKLTKAKELLDNSLAKEVKLRNTSAQVQQDLCEKCDRLKEETKTQIQIFESVVKKHLCRETCPKMSADVDRLLAAMAKYRREISEVRIVLLLLQHNEAKLGNQVSRMEDLGNGLSMKNFTTLQAENQTLDKKIEERNADLVKLHTQTHNNIHILAHYKENQKMLHDNIKMQRKILNNLMDNKCALREHLFSLKWQHNRMNAKIKKLRVQGGLLDKPLLMLDYDNTVKLVAEKRDSIAYLRQSILTTQRKIAHILENCSTTKVP